MAAKPKLTLLTTGGTISIGSEGVPKLAAAALLETIPQANTIAQIEGRDVMAKPSSGFTLDDIDVLANAIKLALEGTDGVVITHGTDTIEETGFALSLLLQTEKPVILTGAMRRADLPGADGPANLLAAFRVAASPASKGKGVMIVMNDEIHSGLFAQKSHSFLPSAFTSLGPLGWVAEDRVRFFLAPTLQPPKLSIGKNRPGVPLLEAGLFFEKKVIVGLKESDGLVLNITGVGHIAAASADDLEKFAATKPVIFASRAGHGETFRATYAYGGGEGDLIKRGLVPAGFLSGRQARVALVLLLSSGASLQDVRDYFLKVAAA